MNFVSNFLIDYCPLYENNLINNLMAYSIVSIIYLQYIVYGIGYFSSSFHFFFLGISLTIDSLINYGLKHLFNNEELIYKCGETPSFPSYYSEHIFFFLTLFFIYIMKHSIFSFWKIQIILFWSIWTVYGQLYLQLNSNFSIFVSSLIGIILGLLFELLNYNLVRPLYNIYKKKHCKKTLGTEKNKVLN